MPNPFPGMDPYLEGPVWSSVQHSLAVGISWTLAPRLRPRYFVLPMERLVRVAPDPIEVPGFEPQVEEINQPFVEVTEVESRDVVTVITVLSPSNKRGPGAEEFIRFRQARLNSAAHYLEVDLLRIGLGFPTNESVLPAPYSVSLSRANRRPRVEVWQIALEDRLPVVPVPLTDGDVDVTLDLQSVLNANYETFSYDVATPHHGQPSVPLSGKEQAWADECLRKAGLKN